MPFERPPVFSLPDLRTRFELIQSRLHRAGPTARRFGGSPGAAAVRSESLHSLRVRHGVACVRAARMWSDRTRPANQTLAEAIRRLQDVGRQLADEWPDERPSVVRLIEASLAVAERQLDAMRAARES